jgi:hypothetical protein
VAIVSEVGADFIEVVQQNAGPFGSTRERYPLEQIEGRLHVGNDRVLGWLRREQLNHFVLTPSSGNSLPSGRVKS